MAQTKISSQIIDGNRLILEPLETADALAGSLGKGRRTHTIEEMKAAACAGIARAGAAGLEETV